MNQVKLLETTETHYRFEDGKEYVYPRVTHIFDSLGLTGLDKVEPEKLERAQHFGKAVHSATSYDDLSVLDTGCLAPTLLPYLEGWRKFRRKIPWAKEIMLNEHFVFSHKWRFAGTLDRVFVGGLDDVVLVDIKTGSSINKTVTAMQLNAYKVALLESHNIKVNRMMVVQLSDIGYKLIKIDEPTALNNFFACLTVYYLKGNK